ncbi:MAG TPA: dTDP-4-dehydrorhamnose 3,5-epimerase family protein [Acetobacteraceae bacterium]|jgi:dTDP-4-dehydrorhamnose 3,5-epimerase
MILTPGALDGLWIIDSDLLYHMTAPYHPELGRGVAWNDPDLAIAWPIPSPILSARDAALEV